LEVEEKGNLIRIPLLEDSQKLLREKLSLNFSMREVVLPMPFYCYSVPLVISSVHLDEQDM
jgi:hypothetical protein